MILIEKLSYLVILMILMNTSERPLKELGLISAILGILVVEDQILGPLVEL